MPLGEIKVRTLTPEETRWRERWVKLEFPKDIPQLWRMSRKEYFAFMYALDPRMALVLSQEPKYREVLEYQRDKNILQELKDYVWRKLHDR